MVYKNNFAVAVKQDGKVLREIDGAVALPFGSEYSVLLKNLNTVRAQVKVTIDGEDVSGWLVINQNSSLDLERFIRNGNLASGNRFKFIERTDQIEEYRGVKIEDGLVRVEYKFEKVQPLYNNWNGWIGQNIGTLLTETGLRKLQSGTSYTVNTTSTANVVRSCNMVQSTLTSSNNDNGITVAGSESNQKFYNVLGFDTEPSQVIVLSLKGKLGYSKVQKPITVYYRPTCTTCGNVNKTKNKFCYNCGTALVII